MNSRELRAQRAGLWSQAQALVVAAEAENRVMNGEEREQFNRLDAAMTELLDRIETMEHLESTHWDAGRGAPPIGPNVATSGAAGSNDPQERAAEHHRIVMEYVRRGEARMNPSDREALAGYQNAALQTSTGGSGGFTIAPAWANQLVEAMKAFGGMRSSGATVIRTAEGQDLPFATTDDTGNEGEILNEGQTATEQAPTFGQTTLKAHVFSSKVVPVSVQLLNDSAFNLEGFLTRIFGQRIGRITNRLFTTGAGATEPQGIVTAATSGVSAAGAAAVTWAEMLDLIHSVDPSYRAMPTTGFMFHDSTLRELKQLVDGNGQPLWSPGTQNGEPDKFGGFRYTINQDVAAMATTAKSILFGDFSAYYIRDVEDMALMRFEDSVYGLKRQVAFVMFSRHDGGLINAGQNPVKYLQNA